MQYGGQMDSLKLGEPAFWILTALAAERRHGYAIISDVEHLSDGVVKLKVTTLYATLERLEREGMVVSDGNEVVNGRYRGYFVISAEGSRRLRDELKRLEASVTAAREQIARNPSPGLATA
jgi:PadR family transcriptional regulator PadR